MLLTSDGGRRMLAGVKTVIVDEIHSLARDKRGSHLSLSLERLEILTGPFQRIGLSATQTPLSEIAGFLAGADRQAEIVDVGHRRKMDLAVEIPPSPLTTVCSHEQWDEIYARVAELIAEHRSTLIFVNTRKLAERIAARLSESLTPERVTCHHSSLSRERRLDAEQRLKAGSLSALVATASLELGIDIGDVDLVIQIGATHSIATFLQRVGRAGHGVGRVPKGRIFPVSIDELIESAALLKATNDGLLDRTVQPVAPLDILAQQIAAACAEQGERGWSEDELFATCRRAWPYRALQRDDFNAAIGLHTEGRGALLHRDGVRRRILPKRRTRIAALTGGGAIPDVGDYRVVEHPTGTFVGTLNEDFAVEANGGDIFQLGNTSWRILRVERGVVRVTDAQGQPPTIPFWLGEGPSRTPELSTAVGELREAAARQEWANGFGLSTEAALQVREFLSEGIRVLGAVPSQQRVILERFFDESGGMQLVIHAPFGGRINRAWGLALRKRFCRGFGYELQAAATDDAIVISLGLRHSFALEDVFNYLHPNSVRNVLTQAVLDQPMFEARWRWNATRALVLARSQNGKPVPPALQRMRADDLLAGAFPAAVACPENMPAGDLPIPMEHPLVRQTIEDCLTEAMDIDGLIVVLKGLRDGSIEHVAIDTPEPSVFAKSILNANPYSFLDDAPLEERRTQAVISRRTLDVRQLDQLGDLDPAAVERVREEAWPTPQTMEEVHEALLWMGFVRDREAADWLAWLYELRGQQRAVREGDRWFAADATREPKRILLGRLEALGPVAEDDPELAAQSDSRQLLLELQNEGVILRTRLAGKTAWCERRLLARIHRYTVETLRSAIQPVSAAVFDSFLLNWMHLTPEHRLEGPRGVTEVLRQLAGFEAPAAAWERSILRQRVADYRSEWLDEVTLSGEFTWGRLWGGGASAVRVTPISFVPRDEWEQWRELAPPASNDDARGPAHDLLTVLDRGGAMFAQELQRASGLVPAHFEMALAELIALGMVTCDSFAPLRQLLTPAAKRRAPLRSAGRWSRFRPAESSGAAPTATTVEMLARQLLRRTGVVMHATVQRERFPVPWSLLIRTLRLMELRGQARGGRFIAGFSGEQFALPEAIESLRRLRNVATDSAITIGPGDPAHSIRNAILLSERDPRPESQPAPLAG